LGAAFLQSPGDAFCNLIERAMRSRRDQRNVVAQVDLHAGDRAANLFGLSDEIVALMGDILSKARIRTSLSL